MIKRSKYGEWQKVFIWFPELIHFDGDPEGCTYWVCMDWVERKQIPIGGCWVKTWYNRIEKEEREK